MTPRAKAILRLDSAAGFAVGVAVLAFHQWLAELYALPTILVICTGIANVAYASYSGALVVRAATRGLLARRAIEFLIGANLAWTAVCGVLIWMNWNIASNIGLAALAIEGAFVAVLAFAEYRYVYPVAN